MNRDTIIAKLTSTQAMSYIDSTRSLFKDLPHVPANIREVLAKIIPVLIIIGAILSAIAGVVNILEVAGVSSTEMTYKSDTDQVIFAVLSLVSAYINFLAFTYLRERSYTGWVLLFWATALSAVTTLISLLLGYASVVGAIIGIALGFYLTFEIESLYTMSGKVAAAASDTVKAVKTAAQQTKKSTQSSKKATKKSRSR